jgi:hypothetical protein
MKPLLNSIFIAILAIAMFGCAEDPALKESPLRLNFKINTPNGQTVTELPEGTSLLISMETPAGEPLYSLQDVSFSRNADGFSTTSLDVPAGDYVMTEFALVNPEGNILYTIPQVNSALSQSVNHPLSINLQASATNIEMDVLDVAKRHPFDFGLLSFFIRNSFYVVVNENGGSGAVAAKATILKGQDTVANFNLPAQKSRISFEGKPNETYTLVVSKEACAPVVQQFRLLDYALRYKIKPLTISLMPAFTMTAKAGAESWDPFTFYLGGTTGTVSVDWGDGTTDSYGLDYEYGVEISHAYAQGGTYPISVTGDLASITYFYSFYGGSVFSEIYFDHLINLNEIRYGLTYCPKVIDLSHNVNLTFAMLPHLANMETLILPETHQITFIEIDGTNQLDTDDVEAFVNNMYSNAVAGNLREGLIGMTAYWAQGEDDYTMVGPPSPGAIAKLETLRDSYGWNIRPISRTPEELVEEFRAHVRRRNM